MVKLFCAVVGAGSVFPVDIDLSKTVGDLKKKIKEKKPNYIYFDADLLKLYLARDDGTWLNSQDKDIKALKAKRFPDRIKNLMQEHLLLEETFYLNYDGCFDDDDFAYFDADFTPKGGDIHVLVECPDEPDQFFKHKRKSISSGKL
ncbi:hypothetical protein PF005_g7879 [Phytophthora fragariae]|uniref:Crinkler effector protein N-terminal domain-containing protein n=1 Tax=Phytophthora fragariae TaxID=53985 RepID=A0A6A3UBA0_9STRA|nr:hypothetical protein PF003_g26729 [Phytophthora fragariae]KAE8941256.1 hypothetical protein PF009_g8953 [Phytophthora fragariae]KAE9015928.1 hypothetical protein PF011_g7394 [Phytophthora fragariae]KAE9119561.1 hypothetical protein PF010_g7825 [Phytophthora fragariae]KAE9120863.1 hypothetical protein PF007_g8013 [Phytophthora fragariae]